MFRPVQISPEKLFDRAYRIAHLYGFRSASAVTGKYGKKKRMPIAVYKTPDESNHIRHLPSILSFYFERSLHTPATPLFILHSNIDRETKSVFGTPKKTSGACVTLTIIGVSDPYAEALMLSCVNRIFRELRSKSHHIRINSMGAKNDSKLYFSNLAKTLRKAKKQMHPECLKLVEGSHIAEAHRFLYDENHTDIAEYIVPTLRLLSESARIHFEQVMEYLERHDLAYELAPDLIEETPNGVHTVFEMRADDAELYARGGRYDTLPFHLYRRKIPVTSVSISLPQKVSGTHTSKVEVKEPRAFFFHAGKKARMQSLSVLSKLCEMNIPVAHKLHCARVCDQLDGGGRTYPYTIIFGEEEAENNTICVRKSETRASSIVRIDDGALRTVRNALRR